VSARRAFEEAERLARALELSIRDARRRALAGAEAQRREALPRLGNEAKRGNAAKRAEPYVRAATQMRERRPELSLSGIARHLAANRQFAEADEEADEAVSARQIFRYLRAAGLK
jgi:hypothetical protein